MPAKSDFLNTRPLTLNSELRELQNETSTTAGVIHRRCPLCDRDNRDQPESPYTRDRWVVKQCPDCGMVYLQNVLPYDELIRGHAWSKLFLAERRRRRREPVFGFLSQQLKAFRLKYLWRDKAPTMIDRFIGQGDVLDVGCGTGKVLRQLARQYTPFGIEIDDQAAIIARWYAVRRGGQVVRNDALSGLRGLDDQQFDGVIMRSFLEHENQPRAVLRQVRRVLKPGGRVVLKVPNFASCNRWLRGRSWCGFRFPDHVNYFTPRTLAAMLQRADLQVACFRLRQRMPTSDNMWLVAQRPLASSGTTRPRLHPTGCATAGTAVAREG